MANIESTLCQEIHMESYYYSWLKNVVSLSEISLLIDKMGSLLLSIRGLRLAMSHILLMGLCLKLIPKILKNKLCIQVSKPVILRLMLQSALIHPGENVSIVLEPLTRNLLCPRKQERRCKWRMHPNAIMGQEENV